MEVPFHTARELLCQGIGAAFLTQTVVADDLANGNLVQINVSDIPQAYRESALVKLTPTRFLSSSNINFLRMLELQAGIMYGPNKPKQ